MQTHKSKVVLILAITVCLFFSGCNTMEGFGKDLEKVGGEIQEAADK